MLLLPPQMLPPPTTDQNPSPPQQVDPLLGEDIVLDVPAPPLP